MNHDPVLQMQRYRSTVQNRKIQGVSAFLSVAELKLQMLTDATTLDFLKSPPGNRLEPLSGNRAGQHSIRVNDQWRVCFIWTPLGPSEVEIVDYH